ncbi:phosphomethylpyrimidine synthase ThiC [Oceanidesulfovibrio marinus]|uniref:Phosphomethylpyrimidine synthase n=1 Tax=Oceanidesulfovibrio marinus TaxID=370038 RepID=A0ABX6NIP5_9BACT|nr:phosphomethylpyrimidine synthase ThiC [Oceanidesulfovibrio marinus]QJT10500.1 phosphomethylpyrimidine synthase ThiC [Oceanidesulfovibrio marinus]
MSLINKNSALNALLEASLGTVTTQENLDEATIRNGVDAGSMVLLGNPNHTNVRATLVGRPATIKVNANIGTSPMLNNTEREMKKLASAEEAGAHTIMDLSTAGDLDGIRTAMLTKSPLPMGTVPLYALAKKRMDADCDPTDFEHQEFLDEIESQAKQGVDFMTLHVGVTRRAAELAETGGRVLGIVSRGGSITARWMARRKEENPLLTHWGEVIEICREHNVTLSLGDGMRPGAGADAGDAAQWEEVIVLADAGRQAREAGCQVMIEGPGHVPMNLVAEHIATMKRIVDNAPLYVLGPLVTDAAPGYDHITAAIGGSIAAMSGADFLCYVTPAEHLTLPDAADVREGVMASRIAAQAAEVALGRPEAVARDREISAARKTLEWDRLTAAALDPLMVEHRRGEHKTEKECAMCGKFCAIRMLDGTL